MLRRSQVAPLRVGIDLTRRLCLWKSFISGVLPLHVDAVPTDSDWQRHISKLIVPADGPLHPPFLSFLVGPPPSFELGSTSCVRNSLTLTAIQSLGFLFMPHPHTIQPVFCSLSEPSPDGQVGAGGFLYHGYPLTERIKLLCLSGLSIMTIIPEARR